MHNVQSPRVDDAHIEHEIVAKGLTAPRITTADIEANIASEHYFTAENGRRGAALQTLCDRAPVGSATVRVSVPWTDTIVPLTVLIFCVLVLKNGFTVTGESACASPENFDAEIGRKVARADAVNKVWPLLGYELKSRLADAARKDAAEIACEG